MANEAERLRSPTLWLEHERAMRRLGFLTGDPLAMRHVESLLDTLGGISDVHGPHPSDGRLCAEGCSGAWPCTTRLEADHALGRDRPQSR